MFNTEQAQRKWARVLDHKDAPKFKDNYRRAVTAALLENQQRALREERGILNETTGTGSIQNFDPILISLVRRSMPNLIAYDVAGVQPMSAPTGLIFALKPKFQSTTSTVTSGNDALYGGKVGESASPTAATSYEFLSVTTSQSSADTDLTISGILAAGTVKAGAFVSGPFIVPGTRVASVSTNTVVLDTATTAAVLTSSGEITFANQAPISSAFSGPVATSSGEALSGDYVISSNETGFKNMGFEIEKTAVTANTRALKANYTMELAQDLKAVHGLDAESELANILSSEILFEINREVIETINAKAVLGAQLGYTTRGEYDVALDADGRWAAERYKSLGVAIDLECNAVAKDTRRGKGNFIICSSNVASVLSSSGMLDYAPALATQLEVDDTGNTFAGVLNGRIKVYVDPYALTDYITVGYRGSNPYDAGIFYTPYVPLTMVRAVDPETFQPRIAFKTRYGLVANPFVSQVNPANASTQAGADRSNFYYRTFAVKSLSLKGATLTTATT